MEEADIEKLAKQDSREEYEGTDKEEVQSEGPGENAKQLSLKIEDLMDDLSIADPDAFERLVIFANDLLKFRRGVSL
jgi:hypothetical protein